MSFHWLRDRDAQEQLKVFWDKGTNNSENYFTKYHPPAHHRHMRPRFILKAHIVRKSIFLQSLIFKTEIVRRLCSWADSGPRQLGPFRPCRDDSVPRTFRTGISLSGVTSTDSLTSQGQKLTDGIFRPVTKIISDHVHHEDKRLWIVHPDH